MKNTGYIGGNKPWNQRLILLEKHIKHLKKIDAGWKNQCFCGAWIYSYYRRKYVCQRCGKWIKKLTT